MFVVWVEVNEMVMGEFVVFDRFCGVLLVVFR